MVRAAPLSCYLVLAFVATNVLANVADDVFPVFDRQTSSCTGSDSCNEGFIAPVFECVSGTCQRILPVQAPVAAPFAAPPAGSNRGSGVDCNSIRDCNPGLVCAVDSPLGKCASGSGIIGLTNFMLNLVQEDYTGDKNPAQPGPTKTSRAFAMIMLAAHDAYVLVTGEYKPKLLSAFPSKSKQAQDFLASSKGKRERFSIAAMRISALTVAKKLYTKADAVKLIDEQLKLAVKGIPGAVVQFGTTIGELWFSVRANDGSSMNQTDTNYTQGDPYTHQPDPNSAPGKNFTLGRKWGLVKPFVLRDVRTDAPLKHPPGLDTGAYKKALDEVAKFGKCGADFMVNGKSTKDVGIFWAYDGALGIGTPPRLYMQVVLRMSELKALSIVRQVRLLTAAAVSMGDAGIAAWLWKYEYDYPRPVIGVRLKSPNMTDWNPRGAPQTNVKPLQHPKCIGITPNFPAYPSGHATFGTAVFETAAKLLGVSTSSISVTFTSDEFNGRNIDSETGKPRKVITSTFSLKEAIQDNLDSRVYLGVHWRFDGTGGQKVGSSIAKKIAEAFKF
jgi:hypothetical protein